MWRSTLMWAARTTGLAVILVPMLVLGVEPYPQLMWAVVSTCLIVVAAIIAVTVLIGLKLAKSEWSEVSHVKFNADDLALRASASPFQMTVKAYDMAEVRRALTWLSAGAVLGVFVLHFTGGCTTLVLHTVECALLVSRSPLYEAHVPHLFGNDAEEIRATQARPWTVPGVFFS